MGSVRGPGGSLKAPLRTIGSITLKLLSLKTVQRITGAIGTLLMYAFNPAFVPRVSDLHGSSRVVNLRAFHPSPFEQLHCFCLVHALYIYVQRTTGDFRGSQHFRGAISFLFLVLIRTKGNPSHVNTFPTGCWRRLCCDIIARICSPQEAYELTPPGVWLHLGHYLRAFPSRKYVLWLAGHLSSHF